MVLAPSCARWEHTVCFPHMLDFSDAICSPKSTAHSLPCCHNSIGKCREDVMNDSKECCLPTNHLSAECWAGAW